MANEGQPTHDHHPERTVAASAQFDAIFEWSPIATLVTRSSDGMILAANTACETLLGWSPAELVMTKASEVGITVRAWSPPAEPAPDSGPIERIRTKDGSEKHVLTSFAPVESGDEPRLLVLLHDMTERELLRERLQRSEQTMQAFLDFAPAVISTRDLDGNPILQNQHVVSALHPPDDLPGAQPTTGLPAAVVRWSESLDAEVLRTGRSIRRTKLVSDQQAQDTMWEFTAFPLQDTSGEVFAVGTIAVDVTEDHRARAELAESEERFRQMASSLDEVFLLWEERDPRVFLYISPAIERITGLTAAQCRDPALRWAAVHPDDRPVAGSAPSPHREMRVRKPDGQIRWVRSRTTMIETPCGEPRRGATTLTDITDQKLAEIEAHRARDRAERADRAKSDFLSGVSHELRTPLNAVLGFAQLLTMNSTLDTVGQAHIGEITRAGRHLLDLINDLLDIARIESGHAEVRLEPVQVRAMIDEAVALLGPVTTTADVHLLIDDVDPQIHVHADPRGVRQVMLNLLSNAVKYNVAGGEVRVSAESTCAGRCRVAVHDTGRGIAPADRERVFQPFVRLEHHDDPIPGSGLGLALCKQLLATMHGDIDFESTVGAGSRFWFDLPVAPHAPDGPAPS